MLKIIFVAIGVLSIGTSAGFLCTGYKLGKDLKDNMDNNYNLR